MGKLSYHARKIEGVKVGQVVSKDLKKRMAVGTSGKAAARDPTLELDISGKKLTDDGFGEFIQDLIDCMKIHDSEHPDGAAKLMELHLQGNELSVKSLAKLSEVIVLATGELRELVISNNNIQVNTPGDEAVWEAFLKSFKDCYVLKKLDIGYNRLGFAGVETLVRVYIQSELDFLEVDADAVIKPAHDNEQDLVEEMATMAIKCDKENQSMGSHSKKASHKSKGSKPNGRSTATQAISKSSTQADLKRYACTRGLRSIPYFIVSGVCTSNADAIHLSSMLSLQRSPEQLLAFLPSGKTITLPETAAQCKGIIWLPSNDLDMVACKMVEMGEAIRLLSSDDSEVVDQLSSNEDGQSYTTGNDAASQRKLQKKLDVEFSRLAKRVRLECLKVTGVHRIQLWSTALKMMIVCRSLLLEDRDRAVDTPSEDSQPEEEAVAEIPRVELSNGQEHEQAEHDPANDGHKHEQKPEHYRFMENIMMNSFYPSSGAFEAEWPAIHELKDRENGVSDVSEDSPVEERSSEERTSEDTPAAGLQAPTAHHSRGARTSSTPSAGPKRSWLFGLPLELWRQIIADAVGAEGILSREQQTQIMRYAADWDVLAYKLTIQGVEDYQQVWKFLETVNCFTYSQSS